MKLDYEAMYISICSQIIENIEQSDCKITDSPVKTLVELLEAVRMAALFDIKYNEGSK